MDYQEYNSSIIKIMDQLKSNSSIKLIDLDYESDQLSQEDIDYLVSDIKDSFNISLPKEHKNFIVPFRTIVCWHYKLEGGRENTGGEIYFYNYDANFIDGTRTAFADTFTPFGKKLYKQGYRFFDSQPQAGAGTVVALKLENNTIAQNVFFVDLIHEDLWDMELGYMSYIEHSIYLKGLYDWQYLFGDHNFRGLEFDITPLRHRLEDYPKLFPGSDTKEYLKRYKDRKRC